MISKRSSRSQLPTRISNRIPFLPLRLFPVIGVFGLAFIVDMATGQRFSPVLGSLAIVASVLIVFAGARRTLAAFFGYAAIWAGFNLKRAFADDLDMHVASRDSVSAAESTMFGGALPSQLLQDRFFDPMRLQSWDIGFVAVYGSFFISPFVMAALIWW